MTFLHHWTCLLGCGACLRGAAWLETCNMPVSVRHAAFICAIGTAQGLLQLPSTRLVSSPQRAFSRRVARSSTFAAPDDRAAVVDREAAPPPAPLHLRIDGDWYDCGPWASDHPGGEWLLTYARGKDVRPSSAPRPRRPLHNRRTIRVVRRRSFQPPLRSRSSNKSRVDLPRALGLGMPSSRSRRERGAERDIHLSPLH